MRSAASLQLRVKPFAEARRNSIQMLLSISQSLQTATLHILRLKKVMGAWRRANTGSALILGGLRSQTVGKA